MQKEIALPLASQVWRSGAFLCFKYSKLNTFQSVELIRDVAFGGVKFWFLHILESTSTWKQTENELEDAKNRHFLIAFQVTANKTGQNCELFRHLVHNGDMSTDCVPSLCFPRRFPVSGRQKLGGNLTDDSVFAIIIYITEKICLDKHHLSKQIHINISASLRAVGEL